MKATIAPKRRKYSIGVLLTEEEWDRINRFIDRTGLKKQFFFHEAILKELECQDPHEEIKANE